MEKTNHDNRISEDHVRDEVDRLFSDYENKNKIVGFFDLLYKIDKRNFPENYDRHSNTGHTK